MRTRQVSLLLLFALMACVVAGPGVGQQSRGDAADKEAIAQSAEAFIEAFNKGDAKALAAFWTPDGDYTNQTGHLLKGREAIEKGFQDFFTENKGLTLRIESHSLRFVTAEVAIEDGTSFVLHSEGSPPSRARYTIVHVKKDGKWLLSSVRDAPFVPPSNHEHLRGLEWAIGEWSAENDKGDAEHLSLSWTENQNFIVGSFAATSKGVSVGQATHWIGWDPQAKRIRSWIFDASGGFGEGAWTKDGDKWVIRTKSVHQDGKNAASTLHIGRIDADTLTLQGTERTVDGKAVPDTKEFKLKRVNEAPQTPKSARNLSAPSVGVGLR
ncbi:MAG TPA: SgcJ/EcaC family oxidoreductase [Gemmataceae bacterium]|nr:SgcJ/EcaC family oxidoreductase [Gemmataceae bacterium]